MLAFLDRVSPKSQCTFLLVRPNLPIIVGISPHGLLFPFLETFECLRSGDLKVGPCCRHKVVVLSSPDDVRIRAIGLLERV